VGDEEMADDVRYALHAWIWKTNSSGRSSPGIPGSTADGNAGAEARSSAPALHGAPRPTALRWTVEAAEEEP
jgi:hypothetical protein